MLLRWRSLRLSLAVCAFTAFALLSGCASETKQQAVYSVMETCKNHGGITEVTGYTQEGWPTVRCRLATDPIPSANAVSPQPVEPVQESANTKGVK